jgi:competence protein ComGC
VKNYKGFTLVEMLGVLIILIMVFMIVFPSLTKIIKDTNEKIDSATVSIIEEATTAYLSEKSDIFP